MQLELDPAAELTAYQKARELLGQGWTQGFYGAEKGQPVSKLELHRADCFCSLGAVRRAVQVLDLDVGALQIETLLSARMGFTYREAVADWNDHPDRTKDQVLARFDELIAALSTKVSATERN